MAKAKEVKEKTRFTDRFKKNKNTEEEGFDIVTDIKEPFSFANFFDTQVLERARRFKALLADKGILFFLTSPFQARSRLIAQLLILCIGITCGVIPRLSSLVTDMQNQAYASEISGLTNKTVGSLTITPAASSNYQKLHMLAFVVEGEDLPSNASKYEVYLAKSYGASDWKDVTYSWTVCPVTDSKRILLVAIDQSKQASGYGAFQLYIQLAGEEVSSYAKTPFEITLSTAQETTDLYDKTGIHLFALTEDICGSGGISEKQDAFEEALAKYQVVLEQAEAMPVDLTVSPTMDELEAICLANRVYRTLTDKSSTEDVSNIIQVDSAPEINIDTVLTSAGIRYGSEFISELENNGNFSDEDTILFKAFESVETAKKSVMSAMDNVNTAAMSWYSTLTSYKLVLNQTIYTESFPYFARCTNSIEDNINYIKDSEFTASDEKTSDMTQEPDDKEKELTSTDIQDEKPQTSSNNKKSSFSNNKKSSELSKD